MFMIFSLFHLVTSSQAVLGGASIDKPPPKDFYNERPREDYYRICPLHNCERCPSEEEIQAPGVGFALETSHGYWIAYISTCPLDR